MSILGFDFYQGPEVKPPEPIDHTQNSGEVMQRRFDWAYKLLDAVKEHDAWGILAVKPNTDVELYDVHNILAATELSYTAHLLLAKEATDG